MVDVPADVWKTLGASGPLGIFAIFGVVAIAYLFTNLIASFKARIEEGKEAVKTLANASATNAAVAAALASVKDAEAEQAKAMASLASGIERLDERCDRIESRQEKVLERLQSARGGGAYAH